MHDPALPVRGAGPMLPGGGMEDVTKDVEDLLELGLSLDDRVRAEWAETVGALLIRTRFKVRDREGRECLLKPNAAQLAYEARRGHHNIVLKARQMGITTWVAARFFLKTITARGVLTVQVAHTREAAEGIFRMVQRFWECLPEELRHGALRRSRANVGQMTFPMLDSEYRVVSAADENAGRGLSVQNLHCSEVSRWPGDASATLAGLRASLAPGGEMVLESTPNGAYGCFHEEWMQAESKGVVQHFFPWWMEEAYVSSAVSDLRDDELALVARHGLTPAQIGFRRSLEASYRGLRTQEFAEDAERCFRATGEGCFDMEAIETRIDSLAAPVETRRGGALQIWLPPVPGREYIVAVDPAGGGPDGDYAAVQAIERETGLQCAELQQKISLLELANVSASLAREYGDGKRGALLVVERNNHGAGVLAYLDAVERYGRIYATGGATGWPTTVATRPAMIGRLGALLAEQPWLFASRRLLAECRTFLVHPGGKTGAANGSHDDCLMAMAIAQAVRAETLERRRAG